jgi:hypothetical protein
MRPGLVTVGIAFLVVGGGALASLFLFPPSPSRSVVDSSLTVGVAPGGSVMSGWIWGENGSSETFSLRWSATAPISVALVAENTAQAPCSGTGCATPGGSAATVLIDRWNASASGSFRSGGTPTYPYAIVASEPATSSGPVVVSVVASGAAEVPEHLSATQLGLTAVAAAIVVGIGGVALFLGLFLRADPYGPAPPIVPLTAEAVEAAYGPPGDEAAEPPGR